MINLNSKDKKILYELDKNCRRSDNQIAKKVRISKQVVNYRIKRLEKEDIIKSYLAKLNLSKLGLLSYKVMIQLQNVNPQKEKEIIEHIKSNKNVNWLVSSFGRWDIIFVYSNKKILEINNNLTDLTNKFESQIKEIKFLLITDMYSFNRGYLSEEKTNSLSHFGADIKEISLDETDLKLLSILSDNARMEIVEISSKLKTSVDVIKYRIKKLIEKEVIQSFTIEINREILGYQYWNVLVKTKNLDRVNEKEIISFFQKYPNIIFYSKYAGDFNLGFEVEVSDIIELHKIITEFRYKFSDIIKDYETILFIEEHKTNYLPKL